MAKKTPVWRRKGIRGGEPCVRGTRIPAGVIVGQFIAGNSMEEIDDWMALEPGTAQRVIRWSMQQDKWPAGAG